jgi:hypothetical protein
MNTQTQPTPNENQVSIQDLFKLRDDLVSLRKDFSPILNFPVRSVETQQIIQNEGTVGNAGKPGKKQKKTATPAQIKALKKARRARMKMLRAARKAEKVKATKKRTGKSKGKATPNVEGQQAA